MAINDDLEEGKGLLRDQNEEIGMLKESLMSLAATISSALEEVLDQTEGINTSTQKIIKSYDRGIVNSIKKMNTSLDKSVRLNLNLAKGLDIQKDLEKERLTLQAKISTTLQEIASAQRIINDLIAEEESKKSYEKDKKKIESLIAQKKQIEDSNNLLKIQNQVAQDVLNTLEETNNQIQKSSGVKFFGGLEDLIKSIPGLRNFAKPFEDAAGASKEAAIHNIKIQKARKYDKSKFSDKQIAKEVGLSEGEVKANKMVSSLTAGVKSLGKSLVKALGPLALLKWLVDAFLQSDKIVGDMAKGLNKSYSEALNMKKELTDAATASGDIFVTSKGMSESLMAINNTLGTNVMLNKENLATFTSLRERAGLTNEELMGMQSIVNATGGDLEDATGELLDQVKATNAITGASINEKTVLKEISKLSSATTLSLEKQPQILGQTIAKAKALGMEMTQLENLSNTLMDFESSISNELEAELLLGRNINLEKARQAALNNELQTVATEIANQVGNAAEFGKMNLLQQQAIAKAAGMSREELARSLYLREQIGNVSKDEYSLRKKQIEELEAKGLSQEQIKEKLKKTSVQDLKDQVSMQDRFNASVEKLKEVFVIVAESLMPIFDIVVGIFEFVGPVLKLLDPLIQQMLISISFLTDIVKEFSSWFTGDDYNFGDATKSQIKRTEESFTNNWGTSAGKLYKSKVNITTPDSLLPDHMIADDVIIPSGYGNTIIKKGKDTIALNNNDTVVAGTNLNSKTPQYNPQPTPNITVNNDKTHESIQQTNQLLQQILNKQGTIKMDSTDVGTAFSVNSYEIQ